MPGSISTFYSIKLTEQLPHSSNNHIAKIKEMFTIPFSKRNLTVWSAIELYSKHLYTFGFPFVWQENFHLTYYENRNRLLLWRIAVLLCTFFHGCVVSFVILLRQLFLEEPDLSLLEIVFFSVGIICSLYATVQLFTKEWYGDAFAFGFNQLFNICGEAYQSNPISEF